MTHPASGLRERKRLRTRALIVAAAVELSRQVGYAHVTTRQIADRADVSESTLFRLFGSKGAIVREDPFIEPFMDALDALPRELGITVAFKKAIDTAVAAIDPADWTIERERRLLLISEDELIATRTQELYSAADRMTSWIARGPTNDASDLRVTLYATFVLSGYVRVPVCSETTPQQWADNLHLVVDMAGSGAGLE